MLLAFLWYDINSGRIGQANPTGVNAADVEAGQAFQSGALVAQFRKRYNRGVETYNSINWLLNYSEFRSEYENQIKTELDMMILGI